MLRLGDGDAITATDGSGRFQRCRLVGKGLERDGEIITAPRPTPEVGVIHAVPAGRKLDEISRMLAEAGVAWLQPVATAGATPFAKDAAGADRRRRRLEAIAIAAMEQSRSGWLLDVRPPRTLTDVIDGTDDGVVVVALDPGADQPLSRIDRTAPAYALAVGPESGWSADERSLLSAARVRLGPEILRTEHAALAAVSAIFVLAGRW